MKEVRINLDQTPSTQEAEREQERVGRSRKEQKENGELVGVARAESREALMIGV